MKKILLAIILSFLFASCKNGFYDILARTTDDPFSTTPSISSFEAIDTIKASWEPDDGADTFILMRAINDATLNYEEVYRGTDCSFVDTLVEDGTLYRYRLDKIRGQERFYGSIPGLGVASPIAEAVLYDNSIQCKAYELTYKYTSSCYYYKFDDDTLLYNYDWYKVEVPAMRKAVITISETGSNSSFCYLIPGSVKATKLINKTSFYVYNNKLTPQYKYFAIFANPSEFITQTSIGGDIRSYTIELTEITSQ